MKHKAAREARLTESEVLQFLHRLSRAVRREVVTPVLVRPLVTESGERVDRLINKTSVGIGILEDIEQVVPAPAQSVPQPFDMLEETEVMPSALLGGQQLAGRLGNRDIGSRGPTPEGTSDVHGETDHFSGGASGSGHVIIASICTQKQQGPGGPPVWARP